MRLFTAIELPEPVREHLLRLRGVLAELPGLSDTVSWVKPENLHVTLKFLGEVPDAEVDALGDAIARADVKPMRLQVDHMVFFPQRGPVRVIAVGLAGDVERLGRVYAGIEDACAALGFEREGRAYTPHVTLGRGRHGRGGGELRRVREMALAEHFPGPEFVAGGFVLMRSQLNPKGAIYTPTAQFSKANR